MTPGDDRVRVVVGSVSLELPGALVRSEDAAIDSGAAVFKGAGLTVMVDQGPFASRLNAEVGRPDYREGLQDVGGTKSRTIFFRNVEDRSYTTALYVPAPKSVTIVVHADASVPEEIPRAICGSLQLHD